MSLRIFALLFGLALIAAGIMGFMPSFVTDSNLFGIFHVDGTHNLVHITTGSLAILASLFGVPKVYFEFIGLFYGAIAILGFVRAGDLYIMHVNMADNILHLAIAVVTLYLGFIFSSHRN